MKTVVRLILFTLTLMLGTRTGADTPVSEWLVVVNANTPIENLTQKQVMGLFLGRSKFLPSGERAQAIDFPLDSEQRAQFYEALTGKSIADVDAYWARLKYSGKATSPTPLEGSEQIIAAVSQYSSAIAYIPASRRDELASNGLKTVLSMKTE